MAWDLLVGRDDLSRVEVRDAAPAELAEGEVRVAIERFSLTANNITYGVFGDSMGYWRFYPAPDDWGRIPVWGFGRVEASRAEGVAEGTRLYGYWPMSSHATLRLRSSGSGYVEHSSNRADLAAAYNRYDPAAQTDQDDRLALLRPLFTTSFLLDDLLGEMADGATAILSSASSRTALGLAWMLAERGSPPFGLTSPRNAEFVLGTGLYSQVVEYGGAGALEVDGPVAFVDMAGDAAVRGAVHRRLGERLIHSAVVGSTHHAAAPATREPLPGPPPSFFFAPDRVVKRRDDWGGGELNSRVADAMARFIAAADWLSIRHHAGPDELTTIYRSILTGQASPAVGDIVRPD